MKNFSEITAIDLDCLDVSITLREHGRVRYYCWVNGWPAEMGTTTWTFRLFDSVSVVIVLWDFDEGHSGVEIENFNINGYEVLPLYQQLASSPTSYIDQKGIWQFQITGPFYPWYHKISGQGFIA